MAGAWLTTDEVIAHIDEQIAVMGKDAFGPCNGYAQLYSGPSQVVFELVIDPLDRNHKRAKAQATSFSATILDSTPIGLFLDTFGGTGVYKYFDKSPHVVPGKGAAEADRVFRHVSRKFVASLWDKVTTAVCGAGKDRVFYTDEIPTIAETIPELIAKLLKSDDIETINDVPAEKIRKLYRPGDYDDVFRLICLSEIRMAWTKAKDSGKAEDFQDYLERKEFYRVERSITWHGTAKASRPIYDMKPEDRLAWKQALLREFVAAGIAASTVSMTGAPTLSAMKMPISVASASPQ